MLTNAPLKKQNVKQTQDNKKYHYLVSKPMVQNKMQRMISYFLSWCLFVKFWLFEFIQTLFLCFKHCFECRIFIFDIHFGSMSKWNGYPSFHLSLLSCSLLVPSFAFNGPFRSTLNWKNMGYQIKVVFRHSNMQLLLGIQHIVQNTIFGIFTLKKMQIWR